MITPALQLISRQINNKVKIVFGTKALQELYKHCKFIKIINAQRSFRKIIMPKRRPGESDIEAYCRIFAGTRKPIQKLPHTYVDGNITKTLKDKKQCVAVFHGCLGRKYVNGKDIGIKVRQHIIDCLCARNMIPVLLGTKKDYINYWKYNNIDKCKNYIDKLSLKDSVSILAQCQYFISNDTGLYHVAGALKKPGLVIWRRTDPIKNKTPFNEIIHVVNREGDIKISKRKIENYINHANSSN
jgi:ADP-heptose:LPS heptosyltransferase